MKALQITIYKLCVTKRLVTSYLDEFFSICTDEDTPTRPNKTVELRKKWKKENEEEGNIKISCSSMG